jgi:hypothetical protein
MLPNLCSRINQPTLDLLSNEVLLTQVRLALAFGASKRAIGRKLGLNWNQVDVLVRHLKGGGQAN